MERLFAQKGARAVARRKGVPLLLVGLGLSWIPSCGAAQGGADKRPPASLLPKTIQPETSVAPYAPLHGEQQEKEPEAGDASLPLGAETPPAAACPHDMVLVEGEYCTDKANSGVADEHGNTPGAGAADLDEVLHECLIEWYAPQNKKRVCEKFAERSSCQGKLVKKRYCIDRYEWPNRKDHLPEVMNRFHQAQVKCAAVEKRLCTESEWTLACEGPGRKPFPYGYERDVEKCHGDEEWDAPNMSKVRARDPEELRRLYQGQPSGQPECVSDYGVYDLPGNADEVVASETFVAGEKGKYDSITTGGPWYKGVRNQCRPKIYTHDEGFYYYYLSFRCCAEVDGAETDPLTPHQKKEGWTMKRVEKTAGISVEEMKVLLEKKETDPTCGCTTTKCRTFCGTLHGDSWATDRAKELAAKRKAAKGPGSEGVPQKEKEKAQSAAP